MEKRAAEILREIAGIKCYSGEEKEVLALLKRNLENFGFNVKDIEGNILANSEKDFWIATHADMIKPENEEKAKIIFSEDRALGYGVCDPKASIASLLLATEEIIKEGEKVNFGIAFFVEEETTGNGSERIAKIFKNKNKKCLILEPTSLCVADRVYSNIEASVILRGKASHGSACSKGINAIKKACKFINEIESFMSALNKGKNEAELNVLRIRGGGEVYSTPENCEVLFDAVFSPEFDFNFVNKELLKIAGKYGTVKIEECEEGFFIRGEARKILEKALKRAGFKVKEAHMRSWCDANNLKKAGFDVAVFGPGELYKCHTEHEMVKFGDIVKTAKVIEQINRIIR